MKRISILTFFVSLLILGVTSCTEDEYMDWKILNEQWTLKNKTATDVKVTASGLQYKVILQGSGDRRPGPESYVTVSYKGKLVDGTVFETVTKGGLSLSGAVTGFIEGLRMMPGGSTYILYIPSELAYGEEGSGTIPPHSTIIFEITLVSSEG